MIYARPPFPPDLYKRFSAVAHRLGYTVRGQKWAMLDLLLAYAEAHPDIFRCRP